MKSYEHNDVPCLSCHRILEAATAVSAEGEKGDLDGNYSVCVYCYEVSIYVVTDGHVSLREATLKELRDFNRQWGPFMRAYFEANPSSPTKDDPHA